MAPSVTAEVAVSDLPAGGASHRLEPAEVVITLALTPLAELLIAAASPARFWLAGGKELREMTVGVALPTPSEMEPPSTSDAFEIGAREPAVLIGSRKPEAVDARELTTIVCVPATAEEDEEVSARTFGSELEPSFDANTPVRSVNPPISFERAESSVPRLEITVSWV